jgi:hypothetical protein
MEKRNENLKVLLPVCRDLKMSRFGFDFVRRAVSEDVT